MRRAYTDNLAPDEEDEFDEAQIMGDKSVQGEVPEGLHEDLEGDEEDEDEDEDEDVEEEEGEDEEIAEKNEEDKNSAEEDRGDNTSENEDEEDPDGDEDEESGDTEDDDEHAVKFNTSRIHGQAAEITNGVPMELEESDGDSSFKGTSDESMRSDDTVHSDSEDEFS